MLAAPLPLLVTGAAVFSSGDGSKSASVSPVLPLGALTPGALPPIATGKLGGGSAGLSVRGSAELTCTVLAIADSHIIQLLKNRA